LTDITLLLPRGEALQCSIETGVTSGKPLEAPISDLVVCFQGDGGSFESS